jgi:serine/threonine-protein kinase
MPGTSVASTLVATQTALSTGRYELGERVGSGGMGEVYRARDRILDRDVAVKLPALDSSPSARERFRREARAAARLDHPNVVRVYDWDDAGGDAFLVMEYVDGQSLHELLRARDRFSVREAAAIGAQVADALEHAHSRGVVHRDIKPANVLVTNDGTVKVTDFGIAHAGDADSLTEPGTVFGTAGYVSPEQMRGGRVDGRADIYSLGMVLARLTAGASGALAPVIARATAPDAAARYGRAADLCTLLRAIAAGEVEPTARLVVVPPPRRLSTPAPTSATPADLPKLTKPPRAPKPPKLPKLPKAVKPLKPAKPKRTRVWRARHVAVLVVPVLLIVAAIFAVFGLVAQPTQVAVPEVVDTDVFVAAASLRQSKLNPDIRFVDDPSPGGTVLAEQPASGKHVDENSTVVITVSRTTAPVPDVSGVDVDIARAKLAATGFGVVDVTYQDSEAAPPGTVLSSTPVSGVRADKTATLALVVAQDPYVKVPNVVRDTVSVAGDMLRWFGLVTHSSTESSRTVPAGQVISVSPAAGQTVKRGTMVTLKVSTGPPRSGKN